MRGDNYIKALCREEELPGNGKKMGRQFVLDGLGRMRCVAQTASLVALLYFPTHTAQS